MSSIPFPIQLHRLNKNALTDQEVFESLTALQAYIANDAAYVGQIVHIVTADLEEPIETYRIGKDYSLEPLAGGGVGGGIPRFTGTEAEPLNWEGVFDDSPVVYAEGYFDYVSPEVPAAIHPSIYTLDTANADTDTYRVVGFDSFGVFYYVINATTHEIIELGRPATEHPAPEDIIFEDGFEVVGTTLGAMKNGDFLPGPCSLADIMQAISTQRIAATYNQPAASLAGTSPYSVEIGTNVTLTLTPNFTKNDGGDITQVVIKKAGTTVSDRTDLTPFNDPAYSMLGNTAYTVEISYGEGPIKNDNLGQPSPDGHVLAGMKSGTRSYTVYRCGFWGISDTVAVPATSAEVRALTSTVNPSKGTTIPMAITAGTAQVVFAYPASLGAVAEVKSAALNFDMKGSFDLSVVSVEGANGATPIDYNVYSLTPDTPFNSADTYTVKI